MKRRTPFGDDELLRACEAARRMGIFESQLRSLVLGHPWVWHFDGRVRRLRGDALTRLFQDLRMIERPEEGSDNHGTLRRHQ